MYIFFLLFINEESPTQSVKCSMLHTFCVAKPEFKPEFSDSNACAVYTTPHGLSHTVSSCLKTQVCDRDTTGPYKPVYNQDVKVGERFSSTFSFFLEMRVIPIFDMSEIGYYPDPP